MFFPVFFFLPVLTISSGFGRIVKTTMLGLHEVFRKVDPHMTQRFSWHQTDAVFQVYIYAHLFASI
jgi:hypothetical protein